MVTLRAYSNPAEAALAKSLLDNNNIACTLTDENAHLYGGAPLAMPVRILVADEQVEIADHVLRNADKGAAAFDSLPNGEAQDLRQRSPATNNPWEILALALLLSVPGVELLLQKHELVLVARRGDRVSRNWIITFSPPTVHLFGALVITAALSLTFLYFYVRREIMRESRAEWDLVSR